MAVVGSAEEIWEPRDGEVDSAFARRYQRSFRVHTDHPSTSQLAVLTATGLPGVYDFYVGPSGEFDTGSLCTRLRATQDQDDPYTWVVTAEYETVLPDPERFSQGASPTDAAAQPPTSRPPEISYTAEKVMVPLDKDLDGLAIANALGEPFDPPIEVERSRLIITVSRYEATFDAEWALTYDNVVNLDAWQGLPPYTVKLDMPTAQFVVENATALFKVTYVFKVKPEKWHPLKILHRGSFVKDSTNPDKPRYVPTDKEGKPLPGPFLLDANGGLLAPGATPVYKEFKGYNLRPFGPLGLP